MNLSPANLFVGQRRQLFPLFASMGSHDTKLNGGDPSPESVQSAIPSYSLDFGSSYARLRSTPPPLKRPNEDGTLFEPSGVAFHSGICFRSAFAPKESSFIRNDLSIPPRGFLFGDCVIKGPARLNWAGGGGGGGYTPISYFRLFFFSSIQVATPWQTPPWHKRGRGKISRSKALAAPKSFGGPVDVLEGWRVDL